MVNEQSITSDTVAAEPDDKDDSIPELLSKGQVIAVNADDTEDDYYLLKVQETVHTLEILGARHCQQVSRLSQGSSSTTTNRIPCRIYWY